MNGIVEMAKLFRERDNNNEQSVFIGTVISLPDLKIQITDKIILTDVNIKTTVNLREQSETGEYIHLNKNVVILRNNNIFYCLGVIWNG